MCGIAQQKIGKKNNSEIVATLAALRTDIKRIKIAIKRQLSLLGSVDWCLTNFMTNIIFQALLIFILFMLERREAYKIPRPEYDVAYAGK